MSIKILLLLNQEQDYLQYQIFNGLCEVLGEDNVVMYPPVLSYMGFLDKSYILADGKRGATGPGAYVVPRNMRLWTFEEIIEGIKEFDFILLASPRIYNIRALRFMKKHFASILPPVVFMDGEDSIVVRKDLMSEFEVVASFKRELTKNLEKENIFPLPFSSTVSYLPYYDELLKMEKSSDIFGLFGNTNVRRSEAVRFLLKKNYPNSCIGIDTGALPWQNEERFKIPPLKGYRKYLEFIASSKINLVIRGHGMDTVRRFEVMSFETLVLSDKLPLLTPYLPKDGVHVVYFDDLPDLEKKIDFYSENEEARLKIAKQGKEYADKYHTNVARVQYLLDITEKILSGEKVKLEDYEVKSIIQNGT